MKKLITSILAVAVLGIALPVMPVPNSNSSIILTAEAKTKAKKTKKKKQSKLEKAKEKDTSSRVSRLKSMGVSKSFYEGTYGGHMSRREFGTALGKWIVDVYARTGQLPSFKSSDLSDWVVLRVNGQCYSSAELCARWAE